MRTTVTINDELLAEAKARAARQHRSLGDVVDDALRISFARSVHRRPPIELPVDGEPGQRFLIDINDKEALAETLGENEWPRADR